MTRQMRSRGFSLVEVMLGVLILLFGLLSLSGMAGQSLRQLRASDADSRLLLASLNLAEAMQADQQQALSGRSGGRYAASAQEQLQQDVRVLWPEGQGGSLLLCRHAGALPAVPLAQDCQASGRVWLLQPAVAAGLLPLALE
ncbi:prepilin-type N-terminal cleavage/methylation domain-containing protein [Aquitalea magnusonii]|uniref:Pilin/secretion family protein with methylation motif n=1 Tax=Aquitalea magnusonii TaxID=332411 RepID=A0A318JFL5_9NEIS|nr:prepilin-type N-terminal cleavage/methylation domain-containing protein [Aquitalea magnusonii]PXX46009.1 pilin/secretion family protein with methylation motif [Aquitalea magnusonii]